ncbi:MAG: DUF309 domain-containing protein [Chloroflexota bacterium]
MGAPPQMPTQRGARRALEVAWLAHLAAGNPLPDPAAMSAAPAWKQAIALTRVGGWLPAHEAWEACWRAAPYPQRLLPLALAKLTAAQVLDRRGQRSRAGVARLRAEAAGLLAPFPPNYAGLDVDTLRAGLHAIRLREG